MQFPPSKARFAPLNYLLTAGAAVFVLFAALDCRETQALADHGKHATALRVDVFEDRYGKHRARVAYPDPMLGIATEAFRVPMPDEAFAQWRLRLPLEIVYLPEDPQVVRFADDSRRPWPEVAISLACLVGQWWYLRRLKLARAARLAATAAAQAAG